TGPGYTVDRTPPAVSSIALVETSPTNASTVHYTVTFTEAVTGVDTGDFAARASGVTGASVTGVAQVDASHYTVTVDSGSGDGSLAIDFSAGAHGGVTDSAGILATPPFTTGPSYTIDRTAPAVSSIALAETSPTNLSAVHFTVTFSEAVTGVDTGDFQ